MTFRSWFKLKRESFHFEKEEMMYIKLYDKNRGKNKGKLGMGKQ